MSEAVGLARVGPASLDRSELGRRLVERTLELVNIPSRSREEAEILRRVEEALPDRNWSVVDRGDACLVAATPTRSGCGRVVLAGHVDTVPPRGNLPGSVEPKAQGVAGLGASDMKGSIAVMLEVAEVVAAGRLATDLDLALLFFGREELPIVESALSPALTRCAALRDADLAIVMEPTANALEIGCLGNLTGTVTFRGRTAHSARPWLGSNAIHAAVRGLRRIVGLGVRDVKVGDLVYREVASVTTIEGGIASNVVPDEVRCVVNLRYAPTRAPEEAEAALRELLAPEADADIEIDIDIVGNAPPGAIPRDNALVARLCSAGDLAVRPKQAWTPVAEFAAAGVDAVNFGPGDPELAHRADERIGREALVRSFEILCAFLSGLDAPLEGREPVR